MYKNREIWKGRIVSEEETQLWMRTVVVTECTTFELFLAENQISGRQTISMDSTSLEMEQQTRANGTNKPTSWKDLVATQEEAQTLTVPESVYGKLENDARVCNIFTIVQP